MKKRLSSFIDEGMDVRPWLLFTLAISIAAFFSSLVFVQTITEGLHPSEIEILNNGNVNFLGGLKVSPLLPQSLLSLGLLNLPLASVELATVFQIIIAVVAMTLLFELIRSYYDSRYALLTVFVVSSGPTFLATSTWISSVWLSFIVLVMMILALVQLRRGHWLGYVLWPILAATLTGFGTLGLILAILAVLAVGYSVKYHRLERPGKWTVVGMATCLAIVVAMHWLLISTISFNQYISEFAAPSLSTFIDNFSLLVVGGVNPFGWPTNWPLWNIAHIGLVLLGLTLAIQRRQAERYKLSIALSGLFIIGLSLPLSDITLALGALVSGLLITAGVRYLIQSWEAMLPRNRLRHVISGVMVTLLIIVISNSALTRRFMLRPSVNIEHTQLSVPASERLYNQFRQTMDDTL